MSDDLPFDVDAMFHRLGRLGRWQVLQYAQLLHMEIICTVMVVGIVFIGYEPPYSCNVVPAENITGNGTYIADGECSLYDVTMNHSMSCIYGYNYSIPKDRTIVTEWDLTCDRAYLTGLGQTLFVFGQAIGAYLFAYLADYFGRRKVFLLSLWSLVVIGVLIGVMPNMASFLALRFLAGAVHQAYWTTVPEIQSSSFECVWELYCLNVCAFISLYSVIDVIVSRLVKSSQVKILLFSQATTVAYEGVAIPAYILGIELFPAEMRIVIGVGFGLSWGFGTTLLAGLAYLMRNYSWRYLEMAMAATGGYIIINTFTCFESPRWLLATGQREAAMKIFQKAAHVNNVKLDTLQQDTGYELSSFTEKEPLNNDETRLQNEGKYFNDKSVISKNEEKSAEKGSFQKIIKHRETRKVFFIMMYIWAVNSLTFYGLTLMSNRMAGNRYLNFFWNAVVEIPSHLVALAGTHWLGRRKTAIALHSLVAVFLLTAITLQHYSNGDLGMIRAVGVLSIIGKFSISASFMVCWIFTPELYPTNLRSLGLGSASFAAWVGGMITPFAGLLAKQIPWAPGLIFGLACIGAVGLILLLPETSGRQLPQSLQEIDVWNEMDRQKKLQERRRKNTGLGSNEHMNEI